MKRREEFKPGEVRPPCAGGCGREAQHRALCHACYKQKQRSGKPRGYVRPYARTPKESLANAALRYANADTDDDEAWEKAWHSLRAAARYYVRTSKLTDPRRNRVRNVPAQLENSPSET